MYYPGISENKKALEISEEASEYVLHAKYRIKSKAVNHAYNYAAIIGVPSLELELGDEGAWTKEEVHLYMENILNVLKYLKVYPGKAVKRKNQIKLIVKGEYLDADSSGRWYAFVGKDDRIKKGQKIGEIKDLFGNTLHEYYAKYDAEVLMVVSTLAIKKGEPIIAYGASSDAVDTSEA